MIKPKPKHDSLLSRYWPWLLIGGAWVWLFWSMMTGQKVVAFRDSAYLYYPLFKWIDAQWAAGELPLWNPYCNFGMPVVADGTSSVFYPGKLVFFAWFLSYPARYGIYLAMHVPLAAAGTYWLSRTLRASRSGATLAAFSFAFGGSVLFQVTNVIYLVSAAWLPFALCCVWKMVQTGQCRWPILAGVTCSMMILGGDPQMVYHVGLIAVATNVGQLLRNRRRRGSAMPTPGPSDLVWLMSAGSRIALMIIVTCGLAAIQLLPTYYWSQLSERSNPITPANVYQAWDSIRRDGNLVAVKEDLLGEPLATVEHSYQFSQPPWSLPELVWPNFSGKPFPTHQRWTSGLAGADRVWVPSLYAGLATVILGGLGFRFWGRRRKQIWLTYLFFFFMLGSFGWYGMVWLIVEIYPPLGLHTQLGPQVGGLYWLMNMLLPEYFMFRYPAKLFVIASLALSVLAGVNFREVRLRRALWMSLGMIALTGAGFVGHDLLVRSWMTNIAPDAMFGPFDLAGASSRFQATLIHSLVVGVSLFIVLLAIQRLAKHEPKKRKPMVSLLSAAIVLITALDTAVSNHWLVPTTEASVFESENPVRNRLESLRMEIAGAEPVRVYRSTFDDFEPVAWERQGSGNRLAEIVAWQRETLYPKHHLGENVILLGSFSSIWPATYQAWLESFEWDRQQSLRSDGQQSSVHKMFHGSLEVAENGSLEIRRFQPEHAFETASSIGWMFEYDPVSESKGDPQPRCLWLGGKSAMENRAESQECRIIEFENSRFVARVSTDRPRALAFFAPVDHGWKVKSKNLATDVETDGQLIELDDWLASDDDEYINLLLLPFPKAGRFEVEFVYHPNELWVGAWISGGSWLMLGFGWAIVIFRNRRANL